MDIPTAVITSLANYGLLGIAVLLFLWALVKRKLVSGSELDRVLDQLQASEAERLRLHSMVEDQILPQLRTQTDVIASLREVLADRKQSR